MPELKPGDRCPEHEEIVRALRPTDYDERHGRYSSAVFKGTRISVGRLAVLPFERLWSIFCAEIGTTENPVTKCGQINVGKLQELGAKTLRTLYVTFCPTSTNPAHAEICGDAISRGLAKTIVDEMKLLDPPATT